MYEENGRFYQTPVNADFKKIGVNVSFTLPITKTLFWQNWWEICEYHLSYNGVKNKQFSYQGTSTLVYSIPKWDAMVMAGIQKYIKKVGTLQGYNELGNDIPLIILQKNLFEQKLSISLIYVPPIKESSFIKYSQSEIVEIPGKYYSADSGGLKLLNNLTVLQLNFHFNQGKQVKITKSSLDNDSNIRQKEGGIGL